jgi:hypothetical protein
MFTDGRGDAIHPHAISQAFERICRRAGVRVIRLHDVRHTHASPTFTIETYQHVLPGMQADAAKLFEHLVTRAGDALLPASRRPVEGRKKPGRIPPEPGRTPDKAEGPGALTWAFIVQMVAGVRCGHSR